MCPGTAPACDQTDVDLLGLHHGSDRGADPSQQRPQLGGLVRRQLRNAQHMPDRLDDEGPQSQRPDAVLHHPSPAPHHRPPGQVHDPCRKVTRHTPLTTHGAFPFFERPWGGVCHGPARWRGPTASARGFRGAGATGRTDGVRLTRHRLRMPRGRGAIRPVSQPHPLLAAPARSVRAARSARSPRAVAGRRVARRAASGAPRATRRFRCHHDWPHGPSATTVIRPLGAGRTSADRYAAPSSPPPRPARALRCPLGAGRCAGTQPAAVRRGPGQA